MSRIDIEDILDRYLTGTASPEEIKGVEAWLDQHQAANAEWQGMDKASREQWLAGLYSEIEERAGIKDNKVVNMPPRRILWRGIAAAAAAIAICFAIYLYRSSQNQARQLTEMNVPAGKKTHIVLTDGSVISLNSGSVLKYPKVFGDKLREVYLSGEGYFDIRHDASKPFIIHTGNVVTTVLGTAFNIKVDNMLHTVIVTVTRGKVSVADGARPLAIVTPNQQVSFNTISHEHVQTDIDAAKATAWLEGDIHFKDITFADAAAELQQRFKVKISFTNEKVKNCRFTGTALKAEKLNDILNVICAFNNASYKIRPDGNIVIDGQGCN